MGNVTRIGGTGGVETASLQSAETIQSTTGGATENLGFLPQTAEERTLFNQAELVRTSLQAQAVPRMDAASEARLAKVNPQLANRIQLHLALGGQF